MFPKYLSATSASGAEKYKENDVYEDSCGPSLYYLAGALPTLKVG